MKKRSFGSDNHSGIHPLILQAIEKANSGYCFGYGEDEYTEGVLRQIEALLGNDCKALFVLNGTGANVVSLASFLKPFSTILAPSCAHIIEDECGAVERFSSCRITPLAQEGGKVSPETVRAQLKFGDQHKVQPAILSISQPTEFETLYTVEEIRALADLMHSVGGYLHVDGSRISNAAAAMDISIKEMIADTGVDVLSFGGTKNGLLIGEAVVVFNLEKNREMAENLAYIRKQATQLYSKNRFIAAQFEAYLKDDLYLQMASHSNRLAKYLEKRLRESSAMQKGVYFTQKVETNGVYISLAPLTDEQMNYLREKYIFYFWREEIKEVRLMCSFKTTEEDIDCFIKDLEGLLS